MYPFREGDFAPRNGWYAAAYRHEVGRSLLSRFILGEPVVLYETLEGRPVALNGRCPHRHFPLGQGRLEGDTLVCAYHGIGFDAAGKCARIPSQDVIPSAYRVPAYPVAERGIWLFIWMGNPELADEALLPDLTLADYDQDGFRIVPLERLEVPARYQLLNDNLLDLTHLAHLHRGSIGVDANATAAEEREQIGNVIRSRRFLRDVPLPPSFRELVNHEGLVDRLAGMDFHAPGFHSGIDEVSIPSPDGGPPTKLTRRRVFHAVTPATRHTTHYFFAFGGWMTDGEVETSRRYLPGVLQEDTDAVTAIEELLSKLTDFPPELMLKTDATAVIGRRKLQTMMDQERASAS
jgi:vanillate O-demethylase monooxygenase subunit